MKLQDFFGDENKKIGDIIDDLKAAKTGLCIPAWSKLEREYNPQKHRIVTDKEYWKDKGTKRKPRPVARITFPLQKNNARRMTQMAFATPVKRIYTYDKKDATYKDIISAIEAIYKRSHIDHINKSKSGRMRMYFASCEVLTIWYAVESTEKHSDYGFETPYKLRCKSYSPMNGYKLYPIFDEYDDLLAMCIEYTEEVIEKRAKRTITHFEIFAPSEHIRYTNKGKEWEETVREQIKINKLPLAYMFRDEPIWEDQTTVCDEIELALSRESEILRHNSAPYLGVSGKLTKKGKKDQLTEGGVNLTPKKPKEIDESDDALRLIEMENGGKLEYITWSQSVEAMKFFLDELKNNSEESLQLSNLSMEKMKAMGNIGYDARQTLLTDPHLKVGEESGEIIIFFEREWKVLCAFLSFMNPKWADKIKKLKCEHEITPFIQNDETATIKKWREANGGEPLVSQKTSIKYSGLVEDEEAELAEIRAEEEVRLENQRVVDIFNTAE